MADSYDYANPKKNDLIVKGRVGIGKTVPGAKLDVEAAEGSHIDAVRGRGYESDGVVGVSDSGHGVYAFSPSGEGLYAASESGTAVYGVSGGYAGFFDGKVQVTGGCAGCTNAPSDRALKANINAINPRSMLDRLAALPIREWSYRSDSSAVRHIGPMAQDFRAAFNLGGDDKHIDMIDANGVTMAAIQALYELVQEKDRQIERQSRQLEQVQSRLARVERSVRRGRPAKRR